jgi:glutamate---cysteine ligase / carboxylate-amine ligase
MNESGLRAAFEAPEPLTVGLEEEAMLLDPETLDLAPVASEIVGDVVASPPPATASSPAATLAPAVAVAAKLELPASQVELITAPAPSVPAAIAALAAGRRALADAARDVALPAVAGTHPFAAPLGVLNSGPRYDEILREYGDAARAQLVCSLQVHVAVGGADRTLAVYNALRGHLPELAALAANAPFHAGRDTGCASVRPLIAALLPRQGVPPAFESWGTFAEALRWLPDARTWWWELRPRPAFGTLELRVPDAQTTLEDAAAVAAFAHAMVAWLASRYDAGEGLGVPATWRIVENRWSALRFGVEGEFTDVETGARAPVRDVLRARLGELAPVAERLGCAAELARASALIDANGALRQRAVGLDGAARWLAERYL